MKPVKPLQKPKVTNRIQISSRAKSLSHGGNQKEKLINPKLDSINRVLLSKIDNILNDYHGHDKLIPDVQNSISTNPQSEINNPFEEVQTPLTKSSFHNSEKQLPKVITKKVPPNKMQNNKKDPDAFMTGVGLAKKPKKKRQNKFIAQTDKEINDMIKNINDIDNMFTKNKNEDTEYSFEGSPEFRKKMEKEMKDFQELVAEIDGYKQELQEEFDEVKYLIKFADNTHKLIDRHKNVIGNIFKGAGLQTRSQLYAAAGRSNSVQKESQLSDNEKISDDSEDECEDNSYSKAYGSNNTSLDEITGVFNKLKKINKIKDNLGNIQDNFLDYHKKLKEKIQRSQSAQRPSTINKI